MEEKKLVLTIAEIALDKQAKGLEILDVTGKVDYADYVVVCGGRSERQVRAIAQAVETQLKGQGVAAIGIEGVSQGVWILMDYGDVVVHVLHEDARDYYDIEGLWLDAKRLPAPDGSNDNNPR